VFRQHVIVEFSSLRGKMDKEDAGRRHGSTFWGLIDAPFFCQSASISTFFATGYKLFL
jgi:hypothetical protein